MGVDGGIPVIHIVLFILYIIYCVIFCMVEVSMMHEDKDDDIFEQLVYQEEQNTVYLHAMEDGRETSGNLYYAFIDDNERVVIGNIPYNESNVNIYMIGDSGKPRIVFHKYYKSYSCEKGHDKYDEYYIYDIYIPSISNIIKEY